MTLRILGRDHSGDSLWFATDEGETDATTPELAHARQQITRDDSNGTVHVGHLLLDESQLTTLIQADSAPQPLYPLEACRFCDCDAVQIIEGDPMCHGHAAGFALAEDESMEAAS